MKELLFYFSWDIPGPPHFKTRKQQQQKYHISHQFITSLLNNYKALDLFIHAFMQTVLKSLKLVSKHAVHTDGL